MAKVFGDIPGLMGVMMLRYCPLAPPRPHSTSSQNHFPHRPMGSDGYSAHYNGHFTAEREKLCSGIMGPCREVALLWVRIWFVQSVYLSNALSCHRYGTMFAHRHGAECGNGRHLFRRTLVSSALSSQGRRLSRQGQTITQRYSLSCNEPETAKCNWAMTADTILGFKGETQKWNGH